MRSWWSPVGAPIVTAHIKNSSMDLHGKTATSGVPSDTSSQPDTIQSQPVTPLVNNDQKIFVDTVPARTDPCGICRPVRWHVPATH